MILYASMNYLVLLGLGTTNVIAAVFSLCHLLSVVASLGVMLTMPTLGDSTSSSTKGQTSAPGKEGS